MRTDHERKIGTFMTEAAPEYKADFAGGSSYIIPDYYPGPDPGSRVSVAVPFESFHTVDQVCAEVVG